MEKGSWGGGMHRFTNEMNTSRVGGGGGRG